MIERLNDVFGRCGIGWRYAHKPLEELPSPSGHSEIATEIALQHRFPATNDCTGTDPVVWNEQTHDWAFRSSNHGSSEPIFGCGRHAVGVPRWLAKSLNRARNLLTPWRSCSLGILRAVNYCNCSANLVRQQE